eukprot:gene8279-8466_t
MQMGTENWLAFFQQLFFDLLIQLEFINRSNGSLGSDEHPQGSKPTTAVGMPLTASAGGKATIIGQLTTPGFQTKAVQQQQQQQRTGGISSEQARASAAGQGAAVNNPINTATELAGTATALLAAPQQDPPGHASPTELEVLELLVDQVMNLLLLAYLYSHMPLMAACAYNYSSAQACVIPAQHWSCVAKRLWVSDLQVEHLRLGLQEYDRLTAAEQLAAAVALEETCSLSTLLAAALSDQSLAVNEASACLQRHLRNKHILLRLWMMFCINTLSRVQIAQIFVYSYPFLPSFTQIMRALCEQHSNSHPGASARAGGPPVTQTVKGYTLQHMERRAATLTMQQERWWEQLPSAV